MITLGSLFDGIGGFPLAASRNGIKPAWASEIEGVPIAITKKQFPHMTHLGDITKINGSKIEPVDIISFGSPCQDLSIAGNRKGLEGERSSLFLHAIRIIQQMRAATNNKYPRWAIWENVPGAFSSNKGEDFRRVLQEITESEIPMPVNGRWAASGLVKLPERGIAWRVLDAQYWGVPQRRKRIFLIADFRENSRPEVLFEPEGLSRDIETGESEGQEVAGNVGKSFGFQSNASITDNFPILTEKTPPLRTTTQMSLIHPKTTGTQCASGAGLNRPSGNGNMLDFVVCIQGNCIDRADTAGCNGAGAKENISYTLNTVDRHAVCYGVDCRNIVFNSELSSTLQVKNNGGHSLNYQIVDDYTIRRLTPLECERLQGFPDEWTAGHSDTKRYRALGNSIAVPCAEFIFQKIMENMREG